MLDIKRIENAHLKAYCSDFIERYRLFEQSIEAFGLSFETDESSPREGRHVLAQKHKTSPCSIQTRNADNSIYRGWLSPSCEACRKGLATITYCLTLDCTHNCYFCFNPNQGNYNKEQSQVRDIGQDLREAYEQGAHFNHIAVTGGEPTLYPDELLSFISLARELYPDSRLRVYTNGGLLDAGIIQQLAQNGLDEIRFSIKLESPQEITEHVFDIIETAVAHIKDVMVEMPVAPDQEEEMQTLLLRLDKLGVRGINLLELGFPFNNSEVFRARGLLLRKNPYGILYEYRYAGGVPIAQSEQVCLRLLEYADSKDISMGVQYCSVDNKNTSQAFQQNYLLQKHFPFCLYSEKDFILRSIKIFEPESRHLYQTFRQKGLEGFHYNQDKRYLEFNPELLLYVPQKYKDTEAILCSHIAETGTSKKRVLRQEVDLVPAKIKELSSLLEQVT